MGDRLVVRVLPEVAAIGKELDYLVPSSMQGLVEVGTQVRIEVAGRRMGGWVVACDVGEEPRLRLRPLAGLRGLGPEPALLELAAWAAWRWAGPRAAFLRTASPRKAVRSLPSPALQPPPAPVAAALPPELERLGLPPLAGRESPGSSSGRESPGSGPSGEPFVLRAPPAWDPTSVVAALAQRGPLLVILPTLSRAAVLAGRLRRAGGSVALLPEDWAQARAGASVVIGARAAAWGPCPGLSAVVVVDGQDEALGQEQAPTWHAAFVAIERARRAGVPCVVTSPCPTLDLLQAGKLVRLPAPLERAGWAAIELVDRRREDPRLGLYSERLVRLLRGSDRVVCVLNRKGRARLLACAACESLVRCERCGAALVSAPAGSGPAGARSAWLSCPRCGEQRPWVCAECGSVALRQLRVGVSRAREELEALAERPVGEVTAGSVSLPGAPVLVGTEAVLRRADRADAVAFLDFDQELLAPRVRAGEEALALLALASRLVGGRHGRVLVQTRLPEHPVIRSARFGDPGVLAAAELPVRAALRLPPAWAAAVVSGPAAGDYVASLSPPLEVLGPDGDSYLVRAPDAATLADGLARARRPAGRLRVAVDPARL